MGRKEAVNCPYSAFSKNIETAISIPLSAVGEELEAKIQEQTTSRYELTQGTHWIKNNAHSVILKHSSRSLKRIFLHQRFDYSRPAPLVTFTGGYRAPPASSRLPPQLISGAMMAAFPEIA